ncbi:MAG: DUF2141 domain-containing protein [Rhodospirillaceae bacterium]
MGSPHPFVSILIRRLVAGALCLAFSAAAVHAADLTVTIIGLENNDGDVHVAVYDKPETFPKGGVMLSEGIIKPENRKAQWQFKNLPPGRYAVATFHDANGNHEFDQGLFGIPLERFGFSAGARAFFSAPDFKDAAFDLPAQGLHITIDVSP